MKNNVVNKNDYELYLMNVPLTLFGNKRRQFIKRELEKVHPCFSEQFSFDSKRCIRKGKVQTLIAVMDKVKVLEYKRNKTTGLHLDGVKTGPLFEGKARYFGLIFLSALLISFAFGIAGSFRKKSVQLEETVVPAESYDYVNEAQAVLDQNKSVNEILGEIFKRIKENDGEIKYLSVSIDGAGEKSVLFMNLSLEKMYPENLLFESDDGTVRNMSISQVSYNGKYPCFEYSMEVQLEKNSFLKPEMNHVSELRDELNRYCTIREENFLDAGFHCELLENRFVDLFTKIDSMDDVALKEISISRIKDGFDLSMSFVDCQEQTDKGICRSLLDYSSLFVKEKKVQPVSSSKKVEVKKIVVPESGQEKNWEQVGKVVQKNGKTIVYYRDEKNQIKGVEE